MSVSNQLLVIYYSLFKVLNNVMFSLDNPPSCDHFSCHGT